MKKIYFFIALILLVLTGQSQTVLSAGDLVFVGSNCDGATNSDDTFAFLLLKDIDAATTIIFTDRGWDDVSGFTAFSGDGEFTWTSGVARSAGEVVTLNMGPLFPAAYSSIGDQLFAIQGSIASPVFIAGLQFNDAPGDDANWDGSSTTNSTSALPNALTNGVNAIRLIDAVNGEQDNWQFSRVKAVVANPITGTPAQIRALVNNRANWNSNNDVVYNPVLEAGCSFVVTSGIDNVNPVITCAADPAPITAGLNGLAAIPDLTFGTIVTDNVSSTANITITQSPAVGTMTGVGVNLITITATDEAGNSASCTNNVTINEPPSTLLSAGDIAFVGFNLDGNDSFAFILLKDIIAGTNIKLTDCGVSNPNTITCAGTGDGTKTWYASTDMNAGDIVTLPGSFMTASVLSSFGDQLFAYQGTSTNPIFLAAIHANVTASTNDSDWDGANTANDDTALPDQLTNGVNAVRLHNGGAESDNWQFNCSLLPPGTTLEGTATQLAALINNVDYWSFSDDTEFVPAAKTGCAYTVILDVIPPDAVCKDIEVQLDAAGSATILASDINNGSTDDHGIVSYLIDKNTFSCTDVGTPVTVTLTVADAAGNTDFCTSTITVKDEVLPTVNVKNLTLPLDAAGNASIITSDIDDGSTDACGIASMSVSPSAFTCAEVGANTVTLTVTDNNGNSSTKTATVTVEDKVDPVAKAKAFTAQLDATGNVTILPADVDDGSADACGFTMSVSPNSFTCAEVGANTVTLTVTDNNGNMATTAATVTVEDNIDPVAKAKAYTAQLDATGNVTVLPADVDDGSSDACGFTMSVSPNSFTCAEVGANTVTLTVTDNNGNMATTTTTVTVEDNIDPVAKAKAFTAQLDAAGNVTILSADVDDGSSDACGIASLSVSPSAFTCAEVGANTVTLTVTDNHGNSSTKTATVTVEDNVDPVTKAKAFTAQLDATGNVTILPADIDDGSADACGFTMSVSPNSFTCTEVGTNTVTLTVTDNNGNMATTTATVTVEDHVDPVAKAKAFTAQLDATGNITILPADVDDGSSDACGIASMSVSPSTFTCVELGPNTVTLTVTDNNGNSSATTATVTVEDKLAPEAKAKAFTALLDATGNVTLTASDVNDNSGDNCGIASMSVTPASFSCADIGPHTVTLTVTDNSGHSSSTTATVTVEDTLPPVVVAKDFSADLDINGEWEITVAYLLSHAFVSRTDNCGLTTNLNVTGPRIYTCANKGTQNLTIFSFDNSGNQVASTIKLTINDPLSTCNHPPVAVCKNITVAADNNCLGNALADDFNNGSSDPDLDPLTFSVSPAGPYSIGTTSVVLSVSDGLLSTTCNASITVVDNTAPVARAKAFTAQLDATGNVTILATNVDDGSSDACGIASMSVSPASFTCAQVGSNMVTLTVTDNNGNSSITTATVTVEDHVAPAVKTKAFTAQLDATGNVMILATNIDDGSSDACGIASMSVLPNSFTCADKGANTVTLTVTDNYGNNSTATAIVTVEDNVAPVAKAKAITAQLDASGNVTILASDINDGSSDACGIALMSVSPSSFTCAQVGSNTVSLTVTDNNGNSSTATAIVTVEDNNVPVAKAKAFTAQLDATGNVTILPSDVDNGSSNTCSFTMSVSPSSFTCSQAGVNTVVLTVTGNNGQSSAATALVTVVDNSPPLALTKAFTAQLDATGNVLIKADDVDAGSNDACGVFSSVLPNKFTCADLGPNTVSLYVYDKAGNLSIAKSTVTVVDQIAPVAKAKAFTAQLDATGNVTISPNDINDGSSDACGFNLSVSPSHFTCANLGTNAVTLTVTDSSGNSSTATGSVTVEDVVAPIAKAKSITVQLDASGQVVLLPSDIDDGSGDACDFSMSVLPATLSCDNLGANTVTLYVTDQSGNTSYAKAIVTVEDHLAPEAKAKAFTALLDATGNVTIFASDIDNGSTDACGFSSTVSPDHFNCTEVGPHVVTLTVTDKSGNSSTATATVTVEDQIAPELIVPANIVQLNDAGVCGAIVKIGEASAKDNCTTVSMSNNAPAFFEVGVTEVIWKATDANGNSSSKIQLVEITGSIPLISNLKVTPVSYSGDEVVAYASLSGNNIISGTWSWGDGSTSAAVLTGTQSSGSHLYSQAGIYSVTLLVENSCGEMVHETFNYVVIYNPCNGYIQGNGTLTTPNGSVIADPKITNQADFNFLVRYKKDDIVPSGKFRFDISATEFHLEATSFTWLVVKDDQALIKGDALVNDKTGYHFIASIVDGDFTVKNGTDYLRLVVWDNSGIIVFDNHIGDPEYARATNPIDKGKIEIHTSKTGDCFEIPTASVQIQDDHSLLSSLIVYPNPVVDGKVSIFIENFGSKDAMIDLTSMTGQQVFSVQRVSFRDGKANLDFKQANLKPGNYLIRVSEIGTPGFGVKQISVSSQN